MKVLILSLSLLLPAGLSFAASGTPDVYKITLQKAEVSKDSGASWIEAGSGDKTVDIASVNSGAQVGAYLSNVPLPDGTYNRIRITISNQFTLQGSLVQDAGFNFGTTFCTDDDGTPSSGACTAEEQAFSIVSDVGFPANLDLVGSTIQIIDSSISFTVASDAEPMTFLIDFDIANSLVLESDDSMHPETPSVSISLI